MGKQAFSKGEWQRRPSNDGSGDVMIWAPNPYVPGGFMFVAEVCRDQRRPHEKGNEAEFEANVRLLLNAPKMYALLREALTGRGDMGAIEWTHRVRNLLEDEIELP